MTPIYIILLTILLSGLMLCVKTTCITQLNTKTFYFISSLFYVITRVVFTLLMFYILDRKGPGDLLDVFYPEASLSKQGYLIYNDFDSSYSILFPYLLSLPLFLWDNPLSIVFLFIIFEILTLLISIKFIVGEFKIEKKSFLWFFIFCPLNILFTVYYIQDEILVAFFMVLAFTLILKRKELPAIIVLILGFYFTKIISIYFFLPLLISLNKKYVTVFLAGITLPNLFLYLIGIDILFPLREVGFQAIGPNIWAMIGMIGIDTSANIAYLILVLLTLILVTIQVKIQPLIKIIKKNNSDILLEFILLYTLIFMTFSRKSFSFYFLIILVFFLIWVLKFINSKRNRETYFSIFNSNLGLAMFYMFLISILYVFTKNIAAHHSEITLDILSGAIVLSTFILQIKLIYGLLSTNFQILKNRDPIY